MNKDEKRAGFLQTLRKKKGLTQQELAELVHYSDKNVSKWETGKSFPTNPNVILKLAEIFEVSFEELMYGEFKTETNEEKIVDNVKEEYVSSYNKYSKTIKHIFVGILLLTIVFLVSIYFIYIKNSVYYYSANIQYGHERNKATLLITNKINVFNFNKLDDTEEKIKQLTFYYKNDKEEKVIFEGNNDDYYIFEKNGYNTYNFRKLIQSDCYLKIKYIDDTEENISIKFEIDYINDNVFPENEISNIKTNKLSSEEIIKKLKDMGFEFAGDNYFQNITDNIICRFYLRMDKIEILINNNDTFQILYSFLNSPKIFYEKTEGENETKTNKIDEKEKINCNIEKCTSIEDFAKYINYLKYE